MNISQGNELCVFVFVFVFVDPQLDVGNNCLATHPDRNSVKWLPILVQREMTVKMARRTFQS